MREQLAQQPRARGRKAHCQFREPPLIAARCRFDPRVVGSEREKWSVAPQRALDRARHDVAARARRDVHISQERRDLRELSNAA